MKKQLLLFFLFIISTLLYSQNFGFVTGKVYDIQNEPLEAASISILNTAYGTISNENGYFKLKIPSDTALTLIVSHIGHYAIQKQVMLVKGETLNLNVSLNTRTQNISEISVEAEKERHTPMRKIETKVLKALPSVSGSIEAILASQPGVVTNNELSSQYSVRGGNFDENLVYVNDIEVYRPFLIRSSQQEGLSFTNSDLVESVTFSAGGFEAKYGDKMSSVLDITYRKPRNFGGSFSASLLGGSFHIEDASKTHRFTQIHGVRYKTNKYILGSLDTKGQYQPSFTDYQGYFTYDVTDKLELSFLGNISRNKYQLIPETQQSRFGDVNQALQLTVYFEGQEVDEYLTVFNALSANYKPNKNLALKFTSSFFRTLESETYDILGQYWLDELERDLSSENFGDIAFNRGVGTFLNHGRNFLDAYIFNTQHRGVLYKGKTTFLWGGKFQQEFVNDELSEWILIDSSGYSIPQYPQDVINLYSSVKSSNTLNTFRITDYFQINHLWERKDSSQIISSAGIRSNYWSFNNQLLVSPRFTFSYEPNWKKDILFRASSGIYHQPPFYRELRDFQGNINTSITAQQSIHFVIGGDYNFNIWNRPFKLVSEIYYKHLSNLIPYEIDNVRIRYYANNNAVGRAYGFDTKINGEFVKGVESWASLSLLKIEEDVKDDFYIEYRDSLGNRLFPGYHSASLFSDTATINPGYIPRPTDQRVTFGLFFQDYIPNKPQYKVHLNLLFGSGLPAGPPSFERYKDTLRLPSYRRVDIGFSYSLLNDQLKERRDNFAKHIKDTWISVEVFNLLQISNTVSYLWIRDVNSRLYAVPNFLTSRRINVKLNVLF